MHCTSLTSHYTSPTTHFTSPTSHYTSQTSLWAAISKFLQPFLLATCPISGIGRHTHTTTTKKRRTIPLGSARATSAGCRRAVCTRWIQIRSIGFYCIIWVRPKGIFWALVRNFKCIVLMPRTRAKWKFTSFWGFSGFRPLRVKSFRRICPWRSDHKEIRVDVNRFLTDIIDVFKIKN